MAAHDHDHAPASGTDDAKPGYYQIMETAVRELLIEKELIRATEIWRMLEVMDSRNPALGAKLVARAWVDPEFRARLLDNGRPPCEELGISFFEDTQLIIVENTEKVHNLLVCTLCSCYPREIIGLPPDWYKLMTRKPLRMWSATASRSKRLAKR
ncbi:MAG: nitrile hydratase subunit alpha [Hyphomicrobiales bacterium]|nr:nitrile hydratase subunit alpha [Hyphomicrobiales bacterium]